MANEPNFPDSENVIYIDGRDCVPPEPMLRTLEACTSLKHGQKIRLVVPHVPHPLFEKLNERKMSYTYKTLADDSVEVWIECNHHV